MGQFSYPKRLDSMGDYAMIKAMSNLSNSLMAKKYSCNPVKKIKLLLPWDDFCIRKKIMAIRN